MFDYFRGPDSTGFAAVTGDKVSIAKVASNPVNLFDMKRFTDILKGYSSRVFLGHNRAATKGAVNDVNAHPYQFGHITGAHNGTLSQASWDALCEVTGEKTGTDSAAIFAAIAKIGIDETVKLLQGAWALVWFDQNENTLNFLRNKERPMWYCYTKAFDRVLWASEHWMLRAATGSAKKDDYDLYADAQNYAFFSMKEDWHYRFDLDALKAGATERPKPKVKTLTGKEPAPVVSHANFPVRTPQATQSFGQRSTTTSSTGTNTAIANSVRVCEGTVHDPFDGYFTAEKLIDITKHGCSWCYEDIDLNLEGVAIFEQDAQILCPVCSGRDQSRVVADPVHMSAYIASKTVINLPVIPPALAAVA